MESGQPRSAASKATSKQASKQGERSEERQVRGNHVNAKLRKAGGDGLEAVLEAGGYFGLLTLD